MASNMDLIPAQTRAAALATVAADLACYLCQIREGDSAADPYVQAARQKLQEARELVAFVEGAVEAVVRPAPQPKKVA